jgi:hypothetical protein
MDSSITQQVSQVSLMENFPLLVRNLLPFEDTGVTEVTGGLSLSGVVGIILDKILYMND